ncbi:MAG: aminotransferase class I/II-fold pyridoxal phosphate-dependent enzyme [Chloroflexia bacterium]|nr:aminotransferase class I/II-fold pyridoxal phosphate-dependent enzyme [Chloroflexia bacterium]
MKHKSTKAIFDLKQFGEFGGVNPSITDSATFTFLGSKTMKETFEGKTEGCFLYSRHWNPMNKYLSDAMAAMEGTEAGWVTGSGMAAITNVIMQLCNSGDHIVASRTVYGGTYAFFLNYLPKFNIEVSLVDITDIQKVKNAIRPNTKLVYTESMTNPLLQISDIPALSDIANQYNIPLVVDNTFTPLIIPAHSLGAHIVVYSMTKFINGKNDAVAGAVCASHEFINSLIDVNSGTSMLLGPALDPLRSANILKNLYTLPIRMQKHSENANFLANFLKELGVKVNYPGLLEHPGHQTMKRTMDPDFGYGGLISIDMETTDKASALMESMQDKGVGYLAVSLGYFRTLFSNSGSSTSSEVPEDSQAEMGLSPGLVRFSVGLDHDIKHTAALIKESLTELGII